MEFHTIKDHLGKIDGCFHSMGVSSVGLTQKQYTQLTYDIKKLADMCFELNPQIVFNYVSGDGTDSSEKGKTMWARIKGKTENYLLNKGFSKALMFRPGIIIPEKGTKSQVIPFYICNFTSFLSSFKKNQSCNYH